MSSKEFYFALRLPAEPSPALIRDLVARVCATACCAATETADLVRQVESAVADVAAGGCELRFTAHEGALKVAVASSAGPLWHTSRPTD